ncbi:MAG: hypothetical protein ACRCWG_17295 [Sarcina sp.]
MLPSAYKLGINDAVVFKFLNLLREPKKNNEGENHQISMKFGDHDGEVRIYLKLHVDEVNKMKECIFNLLNTVYSHEVNDIIKALKAYVFLNSSINAFKMNIINEELEKIFIEKLLEENEIW